MSDRGRACSSPLTLAQTPIGHQADSGARRVFVVRAKRREARLGSALYGESPYFLRGLPSITFRDPAVLRYHYSVEMREGQAP